MKKSLVIISFGILSLAANGQQVEETIKKGNDLYKEQKYEPAAAAYDEALAKDPANKAAKFNRASTTYRLAKPDEAIKSFENFATDSDNSTDRSKAYYNKGAILSAQKKLEESIEAYKNALRQNPNDQQARENLQKALLELKKKNPPPKKENEQKKKQQQQQQQKKQQPRMNQKEAEQKLKLLEQKEKELQQKMQQQKSKTPAGPKDW